jgi:hypothetical protein
VWWLRNGISRPEQIRAVENGSITKDPFCNARFDAFSSFARGTLQPEAISRSSSNHIVRRIHHTASARAELLVNRVRSPKAAATVGPGHFL